MKILVINDMLSYGGAESHCRSEVGLLHDAGHDARLLTVEASTGTCCGHDGLELDISKVSEGLQRFVPRPKYVGMVKRIITEFCPDVVHIHNVNLLGRSMLAALPAGRTVQTVHDYSFVCPKGTCVDHSGLECPGYAVDACWRRSRLSPSQMFKAAALPLMQADRDRLGVRYISPSDALAAKLVQLSIEARVIRNPYLGELRPPTRRERGHFVYVGLINRNKGVELLIDAWARFGADVPDFSLSIAGPIESGYSRRFRERLVNAGANVHYLGALSHSEVLSLYDRAYCAIVPSVWMENYPTTVVEAQARSCLVIGSSRGGIPEIIRDPALTFDVLGGPDALVLALNRVAAMSWEEYSGAVWRGLQRVEDENGPDRFVFSLIDEFRNLR